MSSAFDANNRDVASIFEAHESLGDVRDGNRHDDLYYNHHDEHKCGSWLKNDPCFDPYPLKTINTKKMIQNRWILNWYHALWTPTFILLCNSVLVRKDRNWNFVHKVSSFLLEFVENVELWTPKVSLTWSGVSNQKSPFSRLKVCPTSLLFLINSDLTLT